MNEVGDTMKKVIPILFLFFAVYFGTHKEEIIIPDYAIRFRVIANSNSYEDQALKMKVKEEVENKLDTLMQDAKTSADAKKIIEDNLPWITKTVNNYSAATISFGKNYFPTKTYKGVTYPSGDYESLVITLGKGSGENWWCVMFPPLCLLDAKNNNTTEVDYKFYVKDVLQKYFS